MREVTEAIDFFLRDVMRVQKALNPNDPHDFVLLAHSLQQSVAGMSRAAEADALRNALDTLDVDWTKMSADGRDKIVSAARDALAAPADYVAPKVADTFTVFGQKIVGDTKTDAKRRYKLDISASLSSVDEKVINAVGASQGNYVRDQYGNRSTALSLKVKDVVSSGLEQGLGSADITSNIKDQLGESAQARSDAYWGMIAMTFANRARTYGNLSGYASAGIEWFTFEAVMDERTSLICSMMHGKRFQVSKAIDRYNQVEADKDPEAITQLQPWLKAADGKISYTIGDTTHHVASVGAGGAASNVMSDAKLEAAGITTPPLHGNCRSTIVPDEGTGAEASRPVQVQVPQGPKKPAVASGPDLTTPVGLGAHLVDAFSRFAAAPTDAPAQKDIRSGVRTYLDDALQATSSDQAIGRSGADSYGVLPAAQMAGAAAWHDWQGKVEFRQDYYDNVQKAMAQIGAGDANKMTQSSADGIRTLFHEELHGYSKINSLSYQGVGVGIEEAQTEILARKMARGFMGEDLDNPSKAKFWALPTIAGTFDNPYFTSQGFGSYGEYIGTVMKAVAQAGVKATDVGRFVENAFNDVIKGNPMEGRINSGAEHIDRFVDALEKANRITKDAGTKLRAKLKDPNGGLAPPKKA